MTELTIFFEDLVIGRPESFGARFVSREEVIEFAGKYDPQPFHLDDAAAAASPVFGRLAASGFHTLAMSSRMLMDHWDGKQANMGGTGVDKLRWHKPVYPGDTLSMRTTVLSKRRSRSRPEMGLMNVLYETLNQHGEIVMTYEGGGMIQVRDPSAPIAD